MATFTTFPAFRLEMTGVYRSIPVRVNPRHRTIKTLFRTFLDVVHVKKSDRERLSPDRTLVGRDEFVPQYEESDQIRQLDSQDIEQITELSRRPNIYSTLA